MPEDEIFTSLGDACKYAHVTRQAIYLAIKKGHLKAKKTYRGRLPAWVILKKDLEDYRASKYAVEKRKCSGEQVIDLDKDRWSVKYVAKVLSVMTGRPYPLAHIYYLLRIGALKASKMGGMWVISKEDGQELLQKELLTSSYQMNIG